MTTKYLLVPEQLYRGLVNQEPDNINLDFERKLVEKTKRVKKKPDEKNVHYNQEFRRYLKLKKESDEKPVKVELTNGAKVISKKPKTIRSYPYASSSRRNSQASSFQSATSHQEHLVQTDEDDEPTLVHTTTPTQNVGMTTRQANVTPVSSQFRRRFDIVKRLQQLILANPKKFNVTSIGKILNTSGQAIKNSDLHHSLERIIQPSTENMPSPPGTKQLRNAIKNDSIAARILKGEDNNTNVLSLDYRP